MSDVPPAGGHGSNGTTGATSHLCSDLSIRGQKVGRGGLKHELHLPANFRSVCAEAGRLRSFEVGFLSLSDVNISRRLLIMPSWAR